MVKPVHESRARMTDVSRMGSVLGTLGRGLWLTFVGREETLLRAGDGVDADGEGGGGGVMGA